MDEGVTSMMENSNILTTSIQSISAVSEESSAATEEVSASSSNQLLDIQDIEKESKGLYELAQDLDRLIENFKIN